MPNFSLLPLITEKSSDAMNQEKYTFVVKGEANKIEIKKYIEKTFDVTVEGININNLPSKKRVRGRIIGEKKGIKKAIVTLQKSAKNQDIKKLF